jgi:hypothetical protein
MGHKAIITLKMSKDGTRFAFTKDDGQSSWAPDALDAVDELQFPIEDVLVEEEQRRECLVLGRSGDVTIDSKMAQKCRDVFFGELTRVTFAVKKDSPREIVSQARLQVTFPPRTLKIFLTMRCVLRLRQPSQYINSRGARFLVDMTSPALWASTRAGSLLVSPT